MGGLFLWYSKRKGGLCQKVYMNNYRDGKKLKI